MGALPSSPLLVKQRQSVSAMPSLMKHQVKTTLAGFSSYHIGLGAGLLSALFFGGMSFLVHLGSSDFPSQELLFIRALVGLSLLLPTHYNRLPDLLSKPYLGLWSRALFAAISVSILFYNLGHIGAANATLLVDMSVLFVVLISTLILKERLRQLEWLCIALIFIGNILLNLGGSTIPTANLVLGLFGACMAGCSYILLRQVSQKHKGSDILFVYILTIIGVCLVMPGPAWQIPSTLQAGGVLLGIGLCSTLNQLLLTYSFARIQASLAGILALSAILWAGLFDYIWLGISFTSLQWLAYSVILSAILLLKWNAFQAGKQLTQSTRQQAA